MGRHGRVVGPRDSNFEHTAHSRVDRFQVPFQSKFGFHGLGKFHRVVDEDPARSAVGKPDNVPASQRGPVDFEKLHVLIGNSLERTSVEPASMEIDTVQ